MVRFDSKLGVDLSNASKLEWLETNGLGGFASSSIVGLNTRRYHGLLIAATRPPVGRLVLLSKFEETLVVNGTRTDLSCNQYPGVVHPEGNQYLAEFRIDPFPIFIYRVGDVEVEKRVFMIQGANTTVVEYELRTSTVERCELELRPLIAFRDYHSLTHRNDALNPNVRSEDGRCSIHPYSDLPMLHFAHNAQSVEHAGQWYYRLTYEQEIERGLDFEEDLFNPFLLRFDFSAGPVAAVIISTTEHQITDLDDIRAREMTQRLGRTARLPTFDPLIEELFVASRQFIAAREQLKTVIAGYHWFSDWGRDTMIALRGLTLVTGDFEVARTILVAFANSVDQGMLPNRFPDAGDTPEYNTVDATLWFFDAIYWFTQHTGDDSFVETYFDKLTEMIDWHVHGTRYGIQVNDVGLLNCGEAGIQLTWMDAKVGDQVITPRYGMPVEVQALWYNALRIMQGFSDHFEREADSHRFLQMADRAEQAFGQIFWNDRHECLYDVVNGELTDDSIRPNQILTVSLPYPIVIGTRAQKVVATVERELLTPRGLRTLSRNHPDYHPRCTGGPANRDAAYHQGTVWAWLLGPFVTAYLRVHDDSPEAREYVAQMLQEFRPHLREAGLGQVSEIFDGDPPHAARGCIAQAWSVAELLRIAIANHT